MQKQERQMTSENVVRADLKPSRTILTVHTFKCLFYRWPLSTVWTKVLVLTTRAHYQVNRWFCCHVTVAFSPDWRRGQHPDEEGAHSPGVLHQHIYQNPEWSSADCRGIGLVTVQTRSQVSLFTVGPQEISHHSYAILVVVSCMAP